MLGSMQISELVWNFNQLTGKRVRLHPLVGEPTEGVVSSASVIGRVVSLSDGDPDDPQYTRVPLDGLASVEVL